MPKPEVTKKLLAINSVSSLITRLLSVTVLFWMTKYLLDRLDPEEFELYPVIVAVIAFSPLLSGFLTSGIARYVVEAYAKGDERRVTQIVSTMFPILLAAGVVILALGLSFAWFVDSILDIGKEDWDAQRLAALVWDARLMAALMVLQVTLRLVSLPFCIGPYVRQKFVLLNLITLGTELTRMALLLILLLGVSARVLWIPVASLSASAFGLTLTIFVSLRLVPALRFRLSEFQGSTAGTLIRFGGWYFIGQLSTMIYENADRIVLNKLGTPIDVNAFHVGSLADKQIRQTAKTASAPLQPAMTTLHSQGDKERLANAYLRGNRYAMWGTLFIGIPLFVFRWEVVGLYVEPVYASAATVIALLVMTYPFIFSNHMLPKIAVASANLAPFTLRAMVTHLVNLGLTIYFVGVLNLGAVGPALATFIICAVGQPLLFWALGWRMAGVSGWRWLRETLLLGTIPTIAGLGALYAIRAIDTPESWFKVCLYSAAGCSIYLLALLFCLQPHEKKDLAAVLRQAKARFRAIAVPSESR